MTVVASVNRKIRKWLRVRGPLDNILFQVLKDIQANIMKP